MNKTSSIWLLAVFILAAVAFAEAQPAGKRPRLGILLYSTPENDPNLAIFVKIYATSVTSRDKIFRLTIVLAEVNQSSSPVLPPIWYG